MIKLICDWCGEEVKLKLSSLSNPNYQITIGGQYLHSTDWHISKVDTPRWGVDLCKDCCEVALNEEEKANQEANKIFQDAQEEARKKMDALKTAALESARRKRVPRLERDTTMRQKERQRIADGQ